MKIALICAEPAPKNTGMTSVDLAFDSVLSLLPPGTRVTRFYCNNDKKHKFLDFENLESIKQLDNFDTIIYWGDFLHWLTYAVDDWVIAHSKKHDATRKSIIQKWYSLFMLEDRPDLQKKVIVFGSTLHGLDATQLCNTRYRSALVSLYQNAKLVLLRDSYSAAFVSNLIPTKQDTFGCDCALLLNTQNNDKSENTPYLIYSFGRSGCEKELVEFAHSIATNLGIAAIDIKWLSEKASPKNVIHKSALLSNAVCTVTDTYHCAVSSWRESTPAIGIGVGCSRIDSTLSDKKKEVFYNQHYASKRYLFLEDVIERKDNIEYIEQVSELITNSVENSFIHEMISNQASTAKDKLLASILKV